MLARHSSIYLLTRLVPGALGFAVLALYTRWLSPAEYGTYTLVVATEAMTFFLSFCWLGSSALRLRPAAEDRGAFLSGLLAAYVGLSLALCAAFLVALPYFPTLNPLILISGLALLISHGWFEINVNLLVSGLRAGRAAAVSLARSLVGSCCGILFVWLGMGVPGVIFALVIGMVVPSCWMAASEWRGVTLGRPHWGRLREILVFGIPLGLTYALDSLVYYSDRMIIRYLGTPENVGHYAAGFDVADKSITAILSAIGMAGFAIALRTLDTDGRQAAAKQLALNATTLLALGLPAAVGLAVTSQNIAALLGEQFKTEAARVIPVIAFAVLLGGLRGNYVDHAFHLSKSTVRFAMLVAFTAVLNIVLNFFLIPRLGWIGAAYASLTAYAVSLVANGVAGRHVFPLPYPVRNFAKIIAAAVFMGITVAMVPTGDYPALVRLTFQVIVGAGAYGAAVFAMDLLGLRGLILAVILKSLGLRAARSSEHSAVPARPPSG